MAEERKKIQGEEIIYAPTGVELKPSDVQLFFTRIEHAFPMLRTTRRTPDELRMTKLLAFSKFGNWIPGIVLFLLFACAPIGMYLFVRSKGVFDIDNLNKSFRGELAFGMLPSVLYFLFLALAGKREYIFVRVTENHFVECAASAGFAVKISEFIKANSTEI